MGAAAVPIVAAVIGGGAGVAQQYMAGRQAKKAYRQAEENRYLFSPEDRAAARAILMRSLFGGGGMGMPQAPQPGTHGVPRGATPMDMQFAQMMKMIQDRYSRPTPAYQGYLQGLQERRDARSGVPLTPPQGAASPSAQRQQPQQSGRSY